MKIIKIHENRQNHEKSQNNICELFCQECVSGWFRFALVAYGRSLTLVKAFYSFPTRSRRPSALEAMYRVPAQNDLKLMK